jgi:hypothetical protein
MGGNRRLTRGVFALRAVYIYVLCRGSNALEVSGYGTFCLFLCDVGHMDELGV